MGNVELMVLNHKHPLGHCAIRSIKHDDIEGKAGNEVDQEKVRVMEKQRKLVRFV